MDASISVKKAVLFDLDGTLVDSEWFYYKAWKAVLVNYAFDLTSVIWLNDIAGKTDVQAYEVLCDRYGLSLVKEEFLVRVKQQISQLYEEESVPLMPGVLDLISFLHQRQIILALVTSSQRGVAVYHLEHNGLMEYFTLLVTRTEVTHTKPDPEPYLLCLQELGLQAEDCLVLEDSVTGVTAAKAAGLTCYGVQSHESIRKILPVDRAFDNLHEVREFLEKQWIQ